MKQAAALVPTSASLVYQWVKERRFPILRVGGRNRRGKILIDAEVFRAFIATLTVPAGPDRSGPALVHIKPPR